jgi:hypothetical protein
MRSPLTAGTLTTCRPYRWVGRWTLRERHRDKQYRTRRGVQISHACHASWGFQEDLRPRVALHPMPPDRGSVKIPEWVRTFSCCTGTALAARKSLRGGGGSQRQSVTVADTNATRALRQTSNLVCRIESRPFSASSVRSTVSGSIYART